MPRVDLHLVTAMFFPVIMIGQVTIIGFGPVDLAAGFVLHPGDAGFFPPVQITVLQCTVFCGLDCFLILAQVSHLLFGNHPGSYPLVNPLLLILLALPDRAGGKGDCSYHQCSNNGSSRDELFHDVIPFCLRLIVLPASSDESLKIWFTWVYMYDEDGSDIAVYADIAMYAYGDKQTFCCEKSDDLLVFLERGLWVRQVDKVPLAETWAGEGVIPLHGLNVFR
jgi:hypothetical protein